MDDLGTFDESGILKVEASEMTRTFEWVKSAIQNRTYRHSKVDNPRSENLAFFENRNVIRTC